LAAAISLLIGFQDAVHAGNDVPPLTPAQQGLLQGTLERELSPLIKGARVFEGQSRDFPLKVSVSPDRLITLELGAEAGPHAEEEMEDFQSKLYNRAMFNADKLGEGSNVEFLYGGRSIEYYSIRPSRHEEQDSSKASRGANHAEAVMVSPSHGYYYHHKLLEWTTQRPERNGIIEDFLTPAYARELAFWLSRRSGVETVIPRSYSDEVHEESTHAWKSMGARYHLKQLLPDNKEIWNSDSSHANGLVEYRQDIKSRPLLANYLSAAAAIHLHTNATDDDPAANGTRVIYHAGRTPDEQLANSVVCSMGEIIHATENYGSFRVPAKAAFRSDLAENALANMPSVLVEMGFHTNVGDAAALKDAVFRTASMKGVEKGYRLFIEGKKCEPFILTKVVDDPVPLGTFVPVDAHFSGNPEFKATLITELVECPTDSQCWTARLPVERRQSPIRFFIDCGGTPRPTTYVMRAKVIDADNVDTDWSTYSVNCLGTREARMPGQFNLRTYVDS
jgi:N-acetylmuramoyl-L-alanine amidase